jgi:hypothetical protein
MMMRMKLPYQARATAGSTSFAGLSLNGLAVDVLGLGEHAVNVGLPQSSRTACLAIRHGLRRIALCLWRLRAVCLAGAGISICHACQNASSNP